ncbi:MAG: BLUF domain-containing protein [Polaromonas sp.]|nr:BLUF domain-containing protein [Polaromonas sp.]
MLNPTIRLYEVIYVSTLAPKAPISVVATIARKARPANHERGITGLLIFDGMRFCQQLEGSQQAVLALLERIRQDARHVNVEILHHGALAERRFKCFSLGYPSADSDEALAQLERLEGQGAVDAFVAMLPAIDWDA